MRSAVRDLVLGALAAPLVVTALYWYGDFELVGGPTVETVLYVAVLVAFGVLFAFVAKERLWVTGLFGVALLFLPASPLLGGRSGPVFVSSLWDYFGFGLVSTLLLAGVEYPLRRPDGVRRVVTRRSLRVAGVAGVAHALLVVGLWVTLFRIPWELFTVFATTQLVWMVGGALLLAGVPAFLAVRLRLATPVVVVAGWLVWSAGTTWMAVGAERPDGWLVTASPLNRYVIQGFVPLETYAVLWFLPLGAALAVGAIEYLLRRWLQVSPPRLEAGT